MSEREKFIDGVGVIISHPEDRRKILIVEEAQSDERLGKKAGMLSIPAGHREAGELFQQAAIREAQEETGLENIILTGVIGRFKFKNARGVTYTAQTQQGDSSCFSFDPSEIRRVYWIDAGELINGEYNLRPMVKEAVRSYLDKIGN